MWSEGAPVVVHRVSAAAPPSAAAARSAAANARRRARRTHEPDRRKNKDSVNRARSEAESWGSGRPPLS
jgi:hypothetical protein